MTPDERRVSEHLSAYADIDVTEPDVDVAQERLRHRLACAQERRRSRPTLLAAVAAAVAVLVSVTWWVTRPAAESMQPMRPPTPTPTATTATTTVPMEERVAVPPAGTAPSGPESGTLELFYWGPGGHPELYGKNRVWVYSDGRLVIQHEDERMPRGFGTSVTGLLQRRLTPQGVELLKAEVVSPTGLPPVPWFSTLHVRLGDRLETAPTLPGRDSVPMAPFEDRLVQPDLWLPDSAWADPVPRAYVPWSYAVCAWDDEPTAFGPVPISEVLPAAAGDLLRMAPKADVVAVWPDPGGFDDCWELSTADTGTLVDALEAEGLQRAPDPLNLVVAYLLDTATSPRGPGPDQLVLQPILPHGGWTCNCG